MCSFNNNFYYFSKTIQPMKFLLLLNKKKKKIKFNNIIWLYINFKIYCFNHFILIRVTLKTMKINGNVLNEGKKES